MEKINPPYKCPNCGMALERVENAWRCGNNHSFDIAKEGYVNLILANKKKSLNSGDGKEMIVARNQFLMRGYFDFLIEFILKLDIFQKNEFKKFLDIGCGSAYYLNKIASEIHPKEVYGSDVSKDAIKFSANKFKNYNFSVSNSFDFDFCNNYFDLILSIFSPFKNEEIERILADDGCFILVRPNKDHLKELYQQAGIPQKDKENLEFDNLVLQETHRVSKTVNISEEDLNLLISMTPLTWKINQNRAVIKTVKKITFDFMVNLYSRNIK
jgi:23S rRNA (guanine745-N1)-methyltransferase